MRRVPAADAHAVLAGLMSEADFTEQVCAAARALGYLTYHTADSRRSEPGFPDLVLARPPRLVLAELKTERGRLRPEQAAWLDMLARCDRVEAYLWRPTDAAAVLDTLRATPPHHDQGADSTSGSTSAPGEEGHR